MRMQPPLTAVPRSSGCGVPWMPTVHPSPWANPIQRSPSGLAGPGGDTFQDPRAVLGVHLDEVRMLDQLFDVELTHRGLVTLPTNRDGIRVYRRRDAVPHD